MKAAAQQQPEATVLVFYSGHGWRDKNTEQYYLIQHDTAPFDIPNSALDAQTLTEKLHEIPAKRLMVIIDACHAQGMATLKTATKGDTALPIPKAYEATALPKNVVEALKQGSGRVVLSSSLGTQSSYIRKQQDLSVYTHHLLEALQGAGNQAGDTQVRVSHLMGYLAEQVPKTSQTVWGKAQTPFFELASEDFAVALIRGGKGLSVAGWESEQVSQPNVQVTQTVTGDGNIFSGTGDVTVHR